MLLQSIPWKTSLNSERQKLLVLLGKGKTISSNWSQRLKKSPQRQIEEPQPLKRIDAMKV